MGAFSIEEIDARIATLTAQADASGSSLADLDGDVTLKLLASARLTGRTATEWAGVGPKLALLWGYYSALKDAVAQIVALRGTRPRLKGEQLDQIAGMLLGDCVVLPPDPSAPGARTLLATQHRTTLAWVQSTMAKMFQDIVSVVDRVGAAWTALPRLESFDATLTGLEQQAAQNGIRPPAEVASARSQIAGLRDVARSDPLGFDVHAVDGLARRVDTATQIMRAATQARAEMGDRLKATNQVLDETAAAIEQARGAWAEAAGKIMGVVVVDPDLDALASRLGQLRSDLDSVTTLSRSNWQEAIRQLGQLDQRGAALRTEATRTLGSVRDPMQARNELRGRLDAYHAKALARGFAEDERLGQIYERARSLLFTAPCDVAGAEAAVREYQQGITDLGRVG